MKVACVFATPMASAFKLGRMILPQLEAGSHGAEVSGMMFFDDNIHCLCAVDAVGGRLKRIAAEKDILRRARWRRVSCCRCGWGSRTPICWRWERTSPWDWRRSRWHGGRGWWRPRRTGPPPRQTLERRGAS